MTRPAAPDAGVAPHRWPVRVYWEDTDAGGIVYYANYLKFFERARTEWLRTLGLQQHALREATGGMFVVSAAQVRYQRPARLDDALCIETRVAELGRASIVLQQRALRDDGAARATVLCEGSVRIGWVQGPALQPARIPAAIVQALQPYVEPVVES
ncbi:MAG: tol-pal system-associated acyl-CoA thioesterase [Tepidimonas ignava]|uniref:Acyl-CoA thioester hydrolase n=1 Tax=Tepidimonas ignava TaxID=114249 RepID=A0A4R3L6I8_9BURK|nr:tol-pal system-associated acyl-CoA thioesterase [Tepidimonas ignava]MCX7814261.1 tol-pal system-associated acyl-CoA thioesterase [Tepidimonas ignava]TCS95209.1 acyl-CoA thioester hydrolase [Tepidimonas ignava]TSE19356.1 Acyl-CoA thioesterase YbgC [Tepidimonas ignava]